MSESSGLPPEHEAVRRLLADARHDGPPPPDGPVQPMLRPRGPPAP